MGGRRVGVPEDLPAVAFFTGGRWQRPFGPVRLRARIEGTPEPNEPLTIDIEAAVAISWDSQSDKSYQIYSSRLSRLI